MAACLYDACVLYPPSTRDILMQLAVGHLCRARWTDRIQDEWITAALEDFPELEGKLARTRSLMDRAVPDALVTGYEHLIDGLALPDPDDRHVLAAAIHGGCGLIVTTNLKHFPPEKLAPFGITPIHPDAFILSLCEDRLPEVLEAFKAVRARLKRPALSPREYVDELRGGEGTGLPRAAEMLQLHLDDI